MHQYDSLHVPSGNIGPFGRPGAIDALAIHAEDYVACDTKRGTLEQIDAEISLIGDLSEDQRQRLMEIADRCPIHRTLISEMQIRTTLAVADAATG